METGGNTSSKNVGGEEGRAEAKPRLKQQEGYERWVVDKMKASERYDGGTCWELVTSASQGCPT